MVAQIHFKIAFRQHTNHSRVSPIQGDCNKCVIKIFLFLHLLKIVQKIYLRMKGESCTKSPFVPPFPRGPLSSSFSSQWMSLSYSRGRPPASPLHIHPSVSLRTTPGFPKSNKVGEATVDYLAQQLGWREGGGESATLFAPRPLFLWKRESKKGLKYSSWKLAKSGFLCLTVFFPVA